MARRKYRRSRRRRRSYDYHPRKTHRARKFKFKDGKRIAKGAYAGGKIVYEGGKRYGPAIGRGAAKGGKAAYSGAKRAVGGARTIAKYGWKGWRTMRKFPTPPSD